MIEIQYFCVPILCTKLVIVCVCVCFYQIMNKTIYSWIHLQYRCTSHSYLSAHYNSVLLLSRVEILKQAQNSFGRSQTETSGTIRVHFKHNILRPSLANYQVFNDSNSVFLYNKRYKNKK